MVLFEDNLLVVRRLSPRDYPLLARWLSDVQVLEFYEGRDNPHDVVKVAQVFGKKLDRSVTACIVSYKGTDIGYVQFYPVPETEKSEYGMSPHEIVYGMDQFIGESDYWNRGIGTTLVKLVADYVRTNLGADKIVMDPQAWNTRAIRCYENAGFRKMRWLPKHELHEGEWRDCWLVVYPNEHDYTMHSDDSPTVTATPVPMMPAATVIGLLTRFEREGIQIWIDGGWAVDALLGEETRPHQDLDVVVQEKDGSRLRSLLEEYGYADRVDCETKPWNFLMADEEGHEVDFHVIAMDSDGNGIYGPPELALSYPADAFTGHGFIGGYPVFCISPEWLVQFHTGYEIDEEDRRDVLALHERFGVPLPEEYLIVEVQPECNKSRHRFESEQFVRFTAISMPEEAKVILGAAMYLPTPEKIEAILNSVYSAPETRLFGLSMQEEVVAVVGIRMTGDTFAEILHIAVGLPYRGQGLGKRMIDFVLKAEGLTELYAETDRSAVGFYKRCDFSIESLGKKYPGVERFACRWVTG